MVCHQLLPGYGYARSVPSVSIYNPKCTLCSLCKNAQTICMPAHVGTRLRHALIVGEAPGANEDANGSPFVGRAGSILIAGLRAAGVSRADVTITNAVKCRPPDNRTPEDQEIDTCHRYLDEEIEAYGVTHILALGNVAIYSLLGVTGVGKLRGKWQGDVLPTFHPAYVARHGVTSEIAEAFREDVAEFCEEALEHAISHS